MMKKLRNSLNWLTFAWQWLGFSVLSIGFMLLVLTAPGAFSGTAGEMLLAALWGGAMLALVMAVFSIAAATAIPGGSTWFVGILLGAAPLLFGLVGDIFTKLLVERYYTGPKTIRYTWKNLFHPGYLENAQ